MDTRDTIVAPATPPGEGGVAIVRLSGSDARSQLAKFFRPSRRIARLESHRLYHGHLVDGLGDVIDEVMAVVMARPRSYTREDVAEIHCHGGPLVVQRILDLFIDAGVRLARPGEFTLRAFLNGRLDLTEAEGVIDLIRARAEASRTIALGQLEGRLSRVVYGLRDEIADLLAVVEAHVDFPEEEVPAPDLRRLQEGARSLTGQLDELLASFDAGRILRDGLEVLLLGAPNAGKSSLLNALLGEARAIVTTTPGTTRDTLEEGLSLDGLPLRLVDTAGVRETEDPVEAEGVRRARAKVATADLVLLVLDGSRPPGPDDLAALEACREARVVLVVGKKDLGLTELPEPFRDLPRVAVSAHNHEGIPALKQTIREQVLGRESAGEAETVRLTDRRHREAVLRCREALERFLAALHDGFGGEFLALDLREGLDALGEMTGETAPEEILERIFTRFCIGK